MLDFVSPDPDLAMKAEKADSALVWALPGELHSQFCQKVNYLELNVKDEAEASKLKSFFGNRGWGGI